MVVLECDAAAACCASAVGCSRRCQRGRPVRSYKGFRWGRSRERVPWDGSVEVVGVRADSQLR